MNGELVLNRKGSWRTRHVAAVMVATLMSISSARPRAIGASSQKYSVVVRLDAELRRLPPSDVVVKIGTGKFEVIAIQGSPEIQRNIAIVIDAGPDQSKVLSRERNLGVALVNALSGANTSFSITKAAISSRTERPTQDRSVAIELIREIVGDHAKNSGVAIYDAIDSAIRQISIDDGIQVVIFIGEGTDASSNLPYEQLRGLAESNHVAFFAALVADHSLRGSKSILRYGWILQKLASDTAGRFLENEETSKAARELSQGIGELRLVTFEMPSAQPGRHKVSVSLPRGNRVHAQKAIVIP
jgi:hypothetical protein